MSSITYKRVGDTVVKEETLPAEVQWDDIVEACKVEPDDWSYRAPWEECDGWEHDVSPCPEEVDSGKCRRCYWDRERRRHMLVAIDPKDARDWFGNGPRGASKQVRAEWFADRLARAYEQLVEWHTDGWQWWCVTCDFMGESDSIGGIDDDDYAQKEVVPEVASNVAHALEKNGFTIVGRPEPITDKQARRNRAEYNHARNNGFESYGDYRKFLRKKVQLP